MGVMAWAARAACIGVCLGLVACSSEGTPEGVARESSALISDQMHGGRDGFAWLPPVVPSAPSTNDPLAKGFDLSVLVDRMAADGTLTRVDTFSGTDVKSISKCPDTTFTSVLCPFDGILWKAKGVARGEKYRVRVLAGPAAKQLQLGLVDLQVVATLSEAAKVDRSQYSPLIAGLPYPIVFRIATRAVDVDNDGVFDWADNCPATANRTQTDTNGDGKGDACQCDGVVCQGADACHLARTCLPTTGACSSPAPKPEGTACDDANGCTRADACVAGVCRGSSGCSAQASCAGTGSGATCACASGYTGDGFQCTDIDECSNGTARCSTHASCTNTPGAFTCTCTSGYTGDGATCVTSVSAPIPVSQGGTVTVTDTASPLVGAGVVVPPQVASTPITVTISEPPAVPVEPPAPAVVGPVAHLEPSGVVFSPPVRLTLPYSKQLIDPAHPENVSVLRLEDPSLGWVEVKPISVDANAGTVTVLTSGFSDWVTFDAADPTVTSCPSLACETATRVFDGTWSCTYSNAPDGTSCDDQNGCTVGETCGAGVCGQGTGCAANGGCIGAGPTARCACPPNSTGNGLSCACNTGYALSADGTTCNPVNACLTSPNGGCDAFATCRPTAPGVRTCTCAPTFIGDGLTCRCPDNYSQSGSQCLPINACLTTPNGGCDPYAHCASTGPNTRGCVCPSPLVGDGLTCGCPSGYRQNGTTCTAIVACQATVNGGCDPNATCTDTGPGQRSCTCNAGYQGDGATCTAIVNASLFGVVPSGNTSQVLSISLPGGTGTPIGSLGDLTTWYGQWVLDSGGLKAYSVSITGTATNLLSFDTTSHQTGVNVLSTVQTALQRLQYIGGATLDGNVVGTRFDSVHWQATVIGGPAGRLSGNFGDITTASNNSFAFDAGRRIEFAVGTDGQTPQHWLYSVTPFITNSVGTKIQVAQDYVLGAVNPAGNLIAAYDSGDGWVVVELDTATGVATALGTFSMATLDGQLVVLPSASRVYAHGSDANGQYGFYSLDLTTGTLAVVADATVDPSHLVLARFTGSCAGTGCDARDPGPLDPCALGTAGCSPFATCASSGQSDSTCTCNDGYDGDGYACDPVTP